MRRLLDQEKLELAKYVRQAKGSLSLNAFSQKTGVSKYQLSRIMNGKLRTSLENRPFLLLQMVLNDRLYGIY